MFIFSVIACFVSVIVKLLVAKARPLNDLYCVEWDIKLYYYIVSINFVSLTYLRVTYMKLDLIYLIEIQVGYH